MGSGILHQFAVLFLLLVLQLSPTQQAAGQAVAQALALKKPIGRSIHLDELHRYTLVLQQKQVMKIALNRQGTNVTIRVTDAAGKTIPRISVIADEYNKEFSLFQAPNAGRYTVSIRTVQTNDQTGHYTIELSELISGKAYAARLAERRRKETAVVKWLRLHAIPLSTRSVESNRMNLEPLKELLHDVRFIGLGEQAHGTHEFFAVKHRLLDFLVREMGVRVIVIEGSYAGWQYINNYVTGRIDTGERALAEQGLWAWDTVEMKAVIDWARQYNKTVPAADQLRFAGIDPQHNQYGKDKLLAYLKRVAPERVVATEALFALDLDSLQSASTETGVKDMLKQARVGYHELDAFLQQNGPRLDGPRLDGPRLDGPRLDSPRLAESSGRSEREQMQEYSRVLTQYVSTYDQADTVGVATRDRFMAENCRRLIEHEPAETRFVIWGHNGHIATGGNSLFKPLGAYLREFYGNAYYALGCSFNKGAFLAREAPTADSTRYWLKGFVVKPAPEQSVDWYLARTGLKSFLVDFRTTPQNIASKNWLTELIPMRSIGSVYRPSFAPAYFYFTQLSERFDGLLFVDTITRAHPNPSVKDVVKQIID